MRYRVTGAFERFYLCHCAHCRKDTGSAHAANLFSTQAKLEWLAGEDKLTRWRLPHTHHARCFCSLCGSALPLATEGLLVVPVGSLDDDPGLRPDAHIFVASRAGWDHDLEAVPTCNDAPP